MQEKKVSSLLLSSRGAGNSLPRTRELRVIASKIGYRKASAGTYEQRIQSDD
jgi:hypothetical protein